MTLRPHEIDRILRLTGAESVTSVRTVQSLWNGYGEICRVHLKGAAATTVVVKSVRPPSNANHPRGFGGQRSHQRKLRSYEVEHAFYEQWSAKCDRQCRVAQCLSAERTKDGWFFVFEDLDASGYPDRRQRLNQQQLQDCLRWLAAFHARFIGAAPSGLWEVGTYWHLATRPDELQAIEDPMIRNSAAGIDKRLNECEFTTLVHGDAKVANFCFGPRGVAAVDFQYVGGGCGMKDVAYFFSSCLSDAECEAQAPALLDVYFGHLGNAADKSLDADAIEREWRALYSAAWADFHRFLAGWSPTHWKIHRYTERMTREALATQ